MTGLHEVAGGIIGMPFSLEGFAFFTEAVFIGIYLYGWNRVGPRTHAAGGAIAALSAAASAIFVTTANSWMNTPVGFRLVAGQPLDVNPIAAMTNPAALHETLHMVIAAYAAIGFAVAGIHAFMLLRDRANAFHRRALAIALAIGGLAAVLQPLSGDFAARRVAKLQPIKLAAFEGLFQTQRGAPLAIGGIPDTRTHQLRYATELPRMLSLLAYDDPHAMVRGLDSFPQSDWPSPLASVHLSFQVMVAAGFAMAVDLAADMDDKRNGARRPLCAVDAALPYSAAMRGGSGHAHPVGMGIRTVPLPGRARPHYLQYSRANPHYQTARGSARLRYTAGAAILRLPVDNFQNSRA